MRKGRTETGGFKDYYSDFQNVVLGYYLNSNEILPKPFCRLFSGFDSESDGDDI